MDSLRDDQSHEESLSPRGPTSCRFRRGARAVKFVNSHHMGASATLTLDDVNEARKRKKGTRISQ